MRQGIVKITPMLISEALGFPVDWRIESISMNATEDYVTVIISGEDFPEKENGTIKECQLIVHVKQTSFEVKEIK
jgi:hypothetical protein